MKELALGRWTSMCAVAISMFLSVLLVQAMPASAATLNVNSHTSAEIANQLKTSGVALSDTVTFDTAPQKPDTPGELSAETKQSALKTLNNMRYIAGLDPVSLNDEQGRKAQAAAFVDWSIGTLTHYPSNSSSKPDGMSDDVWNLGNEGAGNANLAWGNATLNAAIVSGWMGDSDANNVERVGHRRWCLNPKMSSTGFGATTGSTYREKYYAMWSFDSAGSGAQTNVSWPGQKMPFELFASSDAWSLSTGNTSLSDFSNVEVGLTRRASSPSGAGSWTFSASQTYRRNCFVLIFDDQISSRFLCFWVCLCNVTNHHCKY